MVQQPLSRRDRGDETGVRRGPGALATSKKKPPEARYETGGGENFALEDSAPAKRISVSA